MGEGTSSDTPCEAATAANQETMQGAMATAGTGAGGTATDVTGQSTATDAPSHSEQGAAAGTALNTFIRDTSSYEGGYEAPGVWCIRQDNPSPMTYTGTNTWIIAEDGLAYIIDPGDIDDPSGHAHLDAIMAELKSHDLTPTAILLSHNHHDHVTAADVLAQELDVPLYGIKNEIVRPEDFHAPCQVERLPFGEIFRAPAGGPELEVIPLKGHSSDSVGFLLRDHRLLLTSDAIFRHGPTVVVYPDGDLGEYFATLDLLEQMVEDGTVTRFLPGHGWPIDDPLRAIRASRKHRMKRLNSVKDALAQGVPPQAPAIANVLYTDTPANLRQASYLSINAQLKYLGYDVEAPEPSGA